MQHSDPTSRSSLRAAGTGILLAISISLGGCTPLFDVEPGENIADEYGEFAGFCGFLQHCGTHGNGGGATGIASESSSDSDSGTGNNTGDIGD